MQVWINQKWLQKGKNDLLPILNAALNWHLLKHIFRLQSRYWRINKGHQNISIQLNRGCGVNTAFFYWQFVMRLKSNGQMEDYWVLKLGLPDHSSLCHARTLSSMWIIDPYYVLVYIWSHCIGRRFTKNIYRTLHSEHIPVAVSQTSSLLVPPTVYKLSQSHEWRCCGGAAPMPRRYANLSPLWAAVSQTASNCSLRTHWPPGGGYNT